MRNPLPCAGAIFLLTIACAAAQTAPASPAESVNGANVQTPPAAPIPPTPSLAPIHEGNVAGTIDSLPAAAQEKIRELNMVAEQDYVAATSPDPIPHAATIAPAKAGQQKPSRTVRAASKAPAQKPDQSTFRGM